MDLTFPCEWKIQLIQVEKMPALSPEQLITALKAPIGTKSLKELSEKSKKPIILIDDLTRPTPIANVLSVVLTELNNTGIENSNVTILIACGTHSGITAADINQKLGGKLPDGIRVITHDCHECELIGYTSTNTPIQINRYVLESDLKIGIGGIYPHPIAGFSGGGKLLALGAGGYDTIRILHDQKKGSQDRDGCIDHEFRREVNEITNSVGYDFSINLVLNVDREVAGVFCGDPEKAFQTGVDYYRQIYSLNVHDNADIVISDMYPFDTDFQYAFDRGMWPFNNTGKRIIKIILASSPRGISDHTLFPVKNPFFTRLSRRMRHFHSRDILQVKRWISSMLSIYNRRNMDIFVVSPGIKKQDLLRVLPKGIQIDSWNQMEEVFSQRFARNSIKNVAIYKTAPLLMIQGRD